MINHLIKPIMLALCVLISNTVLAAQIYTIYGGSQNGVTVRDATTLAQTNFFDPGFTPTSIVAGNNNNMYLTSGNTIYNYSTSGSMISSFTFPDSGINYHQIAYAGNKIYTAYDGSQNGVTVRDSNRFNQLQFLPFTFPIQGITAGANNDMYLTSGNNIYNYSDTGVLLNTFTWPSTSIDYTDTTFSGSKLYTVYGGSQEGVTVRDPNTLIQSNVVTPGFVASGIASGDNNDMYLTRDNVIYHYTDTGTLINSMTFPDQGIDYKGITFAGDAVVPLPAAAWLFLSGLAGMIGLSRRNKVRAKRA